MYINFVIYDWQQCNYYQHQLRLEIQVEPGGGEYVRKVPYQKMRVLLENCDKFIKLTTTPHSQSICTLILLGSMYIIPRDHLFKQSQDLFYIMVIYNGNLGKPVGNNIPENKQNLRWSLTPLPGTYREWLLTIEC